MVRVQESTCTKSMQDLRKRRSQASGMHDRVNIRISQNTRMVKTPSKEDIQLIQEENK